MNRFLRDLLLFVVFCILINLVNFLPVDVFTYRSWEALRYQRLGAFSYGAFYPNKLVNREEYGDLAHHSRFALRKDNIVWRTDRYGNRNDRFIPAPDVLLVGDSALVGSGVSQENTLVNLIIGEGIRAYSIAPRGLNELNRLLANGVVEAPDVVVYECVERNLLKLPRLENVDNTVVAALVSSIRTNQLVQWVSEVIDKVYTQRPVRYLRARLQGNVGIPGSFQSTVDTSFFFLNSGDLVESEENLRTVADQLVEYHRYYAERDIKFVFLPVPNKRTIYHDLVPLKGQPSFLFHLTKELERRGVPVVDTFELLNKNKARRLLYFKDDTHWNEEAIRLTYSHVKQHLAAAEN